MQPLTVFDSHFRAAEGLLKVYRLLDSETPDPERDLMVRLRGAIDLNGDEEVVLLFNDLVVGLVRERAEMNSAFFRQANLALLLRQAVVSACTAMEVYFPALLEAHLPAVIRVRRRNWLPVEPVVRELFKSFSLKADELAGLIETESSDERWTVLGQRILAHFRGQTLSNVQSIQGTLILLGVSDPWQQVANRAGTTSSALRELVADVVKRRNDIVHRGDRPLGQAEGPASGIDLAWTTSHIHGVKSAVLACDVLAKEAVAQLLTGAGTD